MSYPPVAPVTKRKRVWPWVLGAAVLVLACVFGSAIALANSFDSATPAPKFGQSRSTASAPAPVHAAQTAPITKSDIALTVKTTKKDCFGSAGCNVDYQIKAALGKGVEYQECAVTYQVNGLEDAQIGTLDFHKDGTYDQDGYQSGSTSSSSKKLTAKVTEVDC